MAFSTNKKQKLFSEINITPLTDIFLVLLIIMMVVAPAFQSMDNAVEVPEVNNGINIEENKITVSITKEGAIYINGESIQTSQLTDKLIAAKGDMEKPEVRKKELLPRKEFFFMQKCQRTQLSQKATICAISSVSSLPPGRENTSCRRVGKRTKVNRGSSA